MPLTVGVPSLFAESNLCNAAACAMQQNIVLFCNAAEHVLPGTTATAKQWGYLNRTVAASRGDPVMGVAGQER